MNLTINPNPSVSFSPDNTTYCGSVELSGGSPSGGVYSGPGVSNGEFNPATAGSGLHPITYTYTNANGCSNSETVEYEVAVCTGVEAASQPVLEVRPNPMESSTWVSLKNYRGQDAQFNLLLMDATRRKVFEKQIAAEAIREGYQLLIPELASGTYVLMLNNVDYSGVKRLVK
ncbi:MAG: T9SS type A sorting domain-containing protein [Bacteroidia bacterium]